MDGRIEASQQHILEPLVVEVGVDGLEEGVDEVGDGKADADDYVYDHLCYLRTLPKTMNMMIHSLHHPL